MPYVDRPLPEGLELPKLQDKRIANLKHEGRIPGSINRISKDLKSGVLNGAIAHGADGTGLGGLDGYLFMCASRYPKHYMYLLGKLMPMQLHSDAAPAVTTFNIVSVPSDCYVRGEDVERMRAPREQSYQEMIAPPEPERFIVPDDPIVPEEPPMPDPGPHVVRSAGLRERLRQQRARIEGGNHAEG